MPAPPKRKRKILLESEEEAARTRAQGLQESKDEAARMRRETEEDLKIAGEEVGRLERAAHRRRRATSVTEVSGSTRGPRS